MPHPPLGDDPGALNPPVGTAPDPEGADMNWSILLLAGLFEVAWAVGLRYTDGFTRPAPTVVTLAAMAASFYLLSIALRALPLGTAYAVWVGIGAVGAAIAGVVLFQESVNMLKLVSLLLVVAGILGLKLASAAG
jgi:quaternary ammonium compound-resistance protein SugE